MIHGGCNGLNLTVISYNGHISCTDICQEGMYSMFSKAHHLVLFLAVDFNQQNNPLFEISKVMCVEQRGLIMKCIWNYSNQSLTHIFQIKDIGIVGIFLQQILKWSLCQLKILNGSEYHCIAGPTPTTTCMLLWFIYHDCIYDDAHSIK